MNAKYRRLADRRNANRRGSPSRDPELLALLRAAAAVARPRPEPDPLLRLPGRALPERSP